MNKKFNNLIAIRKQHNFTVRDMANILEISGAFYCQLENGKRRLSYDMAIKIAQIFKVTPDYLFYKDMK